MQAVLSPFANGAALGRADAFWRGGQQWRVFLFPQNRPVTQVDLNAKNAEEAIKAAWASLKGGQ